MAHVSGSSVIQTALRRERFSGIPGVAPPLDLLGVGHILLIIARICLSHLRR